MRITVLAGGIGGSRFLLGLRSLGHDVTVIGNNGDDITMFGLRVCPDLDTVMYTLGGGISAERGWGRRTRRSALKDELGAYGVGPSWFGLGDLDLATHIARTMWLRDGVGSRRGDPAAVRAVAARREAAAGDQRPTSRRTCARATGRACTSRSGGCACMPRCRRARSSLNGADTATPAPGVIDAIADCDVLLLPPSNPVVSVGTILRVPGIAEAVRSTPAPVVGVSPIIADAPVRGMADAFWPRSASRRRRTPGRPHYGATRDGGFSTAGSSTRRTPLPSTSCRPKAFVPRRPAVDDRRQRDCGHRRARTGRSRRSCAR